MLGASLHELLPGAPGFRLHMHYGAEEEFPEPETGGKGIIARFELPPQT